MTTHLTARLSWHMDGWNGHVCRHPARNTYCVGPHSYPGDKIKQGRDLLWETSDKVAGRPCSQLDRAPPCVYSINAFGAETLTAFDDPPEFFGSGSRKTWSLPPATVCVWPYEAMYDDEATTDGRVDNDKRLELAKAFFAEIEHDRSLVVHYANFSNPLSEEDANRYAVVGLSRVKKIGQIEFYPDTTAETKRKFGGGYVWQMNVETHYPDQGLRVPYHRYLERPDVLEKIAFVPENPRNFKFGSRHLSDDDALSLVERFVEIASYLDSIGDDSETWSLRIDWLNSLIGELWQSRGLYPGLARVLDLVGLSKAVQPLRAAAAKDGEKAFRDEAFAWLDGKTETLAGVALSKEEAAKVRRSWKLRPDPEQALLAEILPRLGLPKEQIERIVGADRAQNGLDVDLDEIRDNPFLLSERFVGNDPDDIIPLSRIDHGVYPSPNLGGEFLFDTDDPRRMRALCVDRLKYETKHAFMTTGQMLQDVNRRLEIMPEWKRVAFTDRHLDVDREVLEPAIVFRNEGARNYAYLRPVYEAEREIESTARQLTSLADITFKSPVTESHWRAFLYDPKSPLAEKSSREYDQAIAQQAAVCAQVFGRPFSVICGAAGTGKTTIIASILKAIEKAHATAEFLLLAPTGKAADRIREKTGKSASTIHSFLAKHGWLNPNLTVKTKGGKREEAVTTYVVDEASMLDLELTAALFRAIHWNSVQRFILVGDPNQLPPIGRGRVFADIIDWLRANRPECVGELTVNLRQMENRVTGKGTGILDLAGIYVRRSQTDQKNQDEATRAEQMFQRLQDLPADGSVDKDLRLLFWKDADDLKDKLVARMMADMEEDTGEKLDPDAKYKLWTAAHKSDTERQRPEYHQVITPYRHEDFGTEALNLHIQRVVRGGAMDRVGQLAGITLFDKVLQFRNRGASDPIWAYDHETRGNRQVQIFNGELGFVGPHGLDGNKWKWPKFRLSRFQVAFARKGTLAVSYGSNLGSVTLPNGRRRWLRDEDPEDNLELAYAISVHKAQGSEFDRVYFIVPKEKTALLSPELFYTGVTRASRHCTVLVQHDISPLLKMHRPESSHLVGINSSLFEFRPVPDGFELIRREGYLEEGRIHRALADVMVRSKSEVIIANMLFERDIAFYYEKPLYAPDGSFYLPDFTVVWRGENYYWEHLGMLHRDDYRLHWETKRAWYERHFPGRLLTTEETGNLSIDAAAVIARAFA